MSDNKIENLWDKWCKDSVTVGNDPYFIKKREFVEEMQTFADEVRIDELQKLNRSVEYLHQDNITDRINKLKGDK
jgi:hypothetical protein